MIKDGTFIHHLVLGLWFYVLRHEHRLTSLIGTNTHRMNHGSLKRASQILADGLPDLLL